MQKKVFLSCSSKDRKIALTICTALEARGHSCWVSSRDVRPGQNFQESIVRAIRDAGVMVLIFSGNANNSDEIKKEIALAGQSRLMVIPVRVEDVTPSEAFSYELATRQWIDLFDDWEHAMDQLVGQIDSIIPPEKPGAAVPVAKPVAAPESKAASSRTPLLAGLALLLLGGGAAAYFLTQKPVAPPAPQAAPAPKQVAAAPDPAAMEKDLWDSVRDSNDARQLKTYLDKYPKGLFADVARDKLAALTPKPVPKPVKPEAPQKLIAAPAPIPAPQSAAVQDTAIGDAMPSGSANRPGRPAVVQGRQAYASGDYATALQYFQKAAALENPAGQYNVGMLYENGQGVPQNFATAAEWYEKAAAQGNPAAEYNLGVLYDDGKGVPQNWAAAMQLYVKAAAQGHLMAQTRIGILYEKGRGTPRDLAAATQWFEKAAARGNPEAKEQLAAMGRN